MVSSGGIVGGSLGGLGMLREMKYWSRINTTEARRIACYKLFLYHIL